jgi:hypothetical protein
MSCDEMTLADALADPMIQAVMDADGVDRNDLETMLNAVTRDFVRHSPRRSSRRQRCR